MRRGGEGGRTLSSADTRAQSPVRRFTCPGPRGRARVTQAGGGPRVCAYNLPSRVQRVHT